MKRNVEEVVNDEKRSNCKQIAALILDHTNKSLRKRDLLRNTDAEYILSAHLKRKQIFYPVKSKFA